MKEIFKPVIGYESRYVVSNKGRVYDLVKRRYPKQNIDKTGYKRVNLEGKSRHVHQLMAESFLSYIRNGHKKVIDHINSIKTDNRIENLRIVTTRFNVSKDRKRKTSRFTGVCWESSRGKWRTVIQIKGKNIFLGRFEKEEEAAKAYINKLKSLK